MKKIFLIFSVVTAPVWAGAQTIANAGMEAWRSNSAGTSPVVPIAAPVAWFGLDSLVISAGQAFGSLIGAGDNWNRQTYEENTFVHGGSAAVKLISVKQDTLGILPGTLVNAQPLLNLSAVTGGGNATDAIIFEGGTSTTLRPTSVSAWVAYLPGKDATTGAFGGPDKGLLNVQAIATVDGADSVVGNAAAIIDPSTAYVSVTAPVTYTTTAYNVHTVRIIFSGGGGTGAPLDSSILYVDDVSMVGEPQAVKNVYNSNSYKVYPNPRQQQAVRYCRQVQYRRADTAYCHRQCGNAQNTYRPQQRSRPECTGSGHVSVPDYKPGWPHFANRQGASDPVKQ
jgi:hypothetical protein